MCPNDYETRIKNLEAQVDLHKNRLNNHEPIITDYGKRNILFRLIALIALLNLFLHIIRGI
jgi:hypothetical protein